VNKLVVFFLCYFNFCIAQQYNSPLFLMVTEQKTDSLKNIPNLSVFHQELKNIQKNKISQGFWGWSVDTIMLQDSVYTAYIFEGKQYKWDKINLKVNEGLALKAGLNLNVLQNKNVNLSDILTALDKIIVYYEQSGYPFAQINFKQITESNKGLELDLDLQSGQLIKFDSLVIHGDVKVSKKYVQQLIGIQPNSIFNQQVVNQINKRILACPFLQQSQAAKIVFINNKAQIHLYLEEKKANFFNGVIGILPNTNIDPRLSTGSSLIITGELELKVFNSFKLGEKIDFNWRRLQPQTQELNVQTDFNYIAGTPFGLKENFALLKQDSSFVNVDNKLSINYFVNTRQSFNVFWEINSSNVLNNTSLINNSSSFASNSYGLEFLWEDLDYFFNPRKGFYFKSFASIGNKELRGKVDENGKIDFVVPNTGESLSIPKTSILYKIGFNFNYFIPIFKLSTIKTSLSGSWILNDYLLDNEIYRVGGFKSLRGFDERSIFASRYAIYGLEYRLLLERNSFINIFWDGAWVERKTLLQNNYDFPMAFGAGINFETKAGIFSMAYALGKQQNNPFQFRSAKIHFGFISLF
jgi:outer membrane protein assembly factor BamA